MSFGKDNALARSPTIANDSFAVLESNRLPGNFSLLHGTNMAGDAPHASRSISIANLYQLTACRLGVPVPLQTPVQAGCGRDRRNADYLGRTNTRNRLEE